LRPAFFFFAFSFLKVKLKKKRQASPDLLTFEGISKKRKARKKTGGRDIRKAKKAHKKA